MPKTVKNKLVNRAAGLYAGSGEVDIQKVDPKKIVKNKIDESLSKLIVPIEGLIPDPLNARLHPERNLEAIKLSLNEYGQKKPIVVNERTRIVVAGNGTMEAAKALGWTKIAANVTKMTDVEAAGYGLADNRTAELAKWDFEVVAKIDQLMLAKKKPTVGWTMNELEIMRRQFHPETPPEDFVPEIPKTPTSKPGDMWLLGDHRLLCGDSNDKKEVSRLMGNKTASLMATDPPYGVSFGEKNYCPTAKDWGRIKGDTLQGQELRSWLAAVLTTWIPFVKDDGAYYIWSASLSEGHRFYEAIIDSGLHVQSQIVWVKNRFTLGQADYQWMHEPAWYAFKKGMKHKWFGGRDKTTVWEVSKVVNSEYLHPTQKPVELFVRPMEHHTSPKSLVVDPFAGSGSQFIAAQKLDRVCYGMELDPIYVDVCLERWAEFTGKDPIRAGDKKRWSELKKA